MAGMGHEAYNNSARARKVFNVGKKITGLNLADICFGDQTDQLGKTEVDQPAISAANLAEYLYLDETRYLHGQDLMVEAGLGHSLGELPLLAMAEVISVEGMFKLVKDRADATARAARLRPGMMARVQGLSYEELQEHLAEYLESKRLSIPNLNSALQHMISGDKDLVLLAQKEIRKIAKTVEGLKEVKISRSRIEGAFHSPYHMQPAKRKFHRDAKRIDYSRPSFDVMLNNARYLDEIGTDNMASYLAGQLVGPVLFRKSVNRLLDEGISHFVQVGPRPVLTELITDDNADRVSIIDISGLMGREPKIA